MTENNASEPADEHPTGREVEPGGPAGEPRTAIEVERADGARTPWGRITIGLLLVGIGAAWLLDAAGVLQIGLTTVLAAALVIVGVATIAASRRGAHGGLVATGVVLTVLVIVFSAVPLRIGGGIGERSVAPTSVEQLDDSYDVAAGQLRLDLRGIELPAGTTQVEVRVGMGEARIFVPGDVDIEVRGRVAAGEIRAFGRSSGGIAVDIDERFPAAGAEATLVLDLQVGFGQIRVER